MNIRLASELQIDSIVDGTGIRTVLWTQGCSHNCKGCHNPSTHSFKDGFLKNIDELKSEIKKLKFQDGITFSGGDPFFQPKECAIIAKYIQSLGMNVWAYTGFTYQQLLKLSKTNSSIMDFLKEIDVLVDGKFEINKKSLNLKFKGSSNQRVIDMKKTFKQNKIVELEFEDEEINYGRKNEYIFL